MLHLVRRRVARELLVAVGLPSLAIALAGVVWLREETRHVAPALWGAVLAFLLVLAFAVAAIHLLAVRVLVERPLARIVASLRRAEQGEFLLRIPVEGENELGELSRRFNTALAAITDLHARRLDDAQSMASMQRELAFKAELEQQHRLLDDAHRRLEVRLRELSALHDLGQTLNSTLRLGRLLDEVAARVATLGYDGFALLLFDDATGELVMRSAAGVDPRVLGTRLARGEGLASLAAQRREMIVVRDTRQDPRFRARWWADGQHGSLLALPLLFQETCVGVLDFFRPRPDAFGEDEIRFLQAVASQVAMAVANARLHEQTLALSLTDALTGLHNRRSLFSRLEMELERSQRFEHPCAVALIDVDHFRHLADARGHVAADATLREVAEVIAATVRKVDTAARHGAEEFALLLPRADRAAAVAVADKLRAAVAARAFEHGAAQPGGRVTVSVGIACFPDDARDLASLVDCADAALFAAKRRGRDAVVDYAPGMRDDPGRRRSVDVTARAEPQASAR